MQHKCEICDKDFDSLWGLSSHNVKKHDIKPQETFIKHNLEGISPKCNCGCGETPSFLGIKKGFRDFIHGHASRINNNWGHNTDAQKKSKDTQRRLYGYGELVIWNKGLTKDDDERLDYGEKISNNLERNKKISQALKGRKRPQHVLDSLDKGMREYWSKEVNREKQSHKRVSYIKENGLTPVSNLEKYFSKLMDDCGIEYHPQFYVREIKALYDFKIKGKNILIEVDGDFWHCNPNTKHKIPVTEHQIKNLTKDKIKNKWTLENGYTLLRFWETDINDKPEWVIGELKRHLT
jgi:very-short-patch-repair endonuclease